MAVLKRLKRAIPEFREQSEIVTRSYGGSTMRWKLDMAWCLLRYGARPIDYVRFEFHKKSAKERNRYLTIYRYFRMQKYFGAGIKGISEKVEEYTTFSRFIHRRWIEVNSNTQNGVVEDFVSKHGIVIAKPVRGEQGKGVLKISSVGSSEYQELLSQKDKTPFVLEELISNAPEIAAINPSSLNTIRAYTLIKKDKQTKILAIMLRVGKAGSHVDNWGSGGIGYNFDVETGLCVDYGRDKNNNAFVYHPGSNMQMIGYRLPRFDELKRLIVEMSQLVPSARFVGWDIAITPNGFDLVEMNCPGGHDFLQVFGEPFGDVLKHELK
jgi:hypothetical protein